MKFALPAAPPLRRAAALLSFGFRALHKDIR